MASSTMTCARNRILRRRSSTSGVVAWKLLFMRKFMDLVVRSPRTAARRILIWETLSFGRENAGAGCENERQSLCNAYWHEISLERERERVPIEF